MGGVGVDHKGLGIIHQPFYRNGGRFAESSLREIERRKSQKTRSKSERCRYRVFTATRARRFAHNPRITFRWLLRARRPCSARRRAALRLVAPPALGFVAAACPPGAPAASFCNEGGEWRRPFFSLACLGLGRKNDKSGPRFAARSCRRRRLANGF